MRMRKMKNLEPRMERCADLRVAEPAALKGNWRSLKPDAVALWVEVGCGKGKFILENATLNPDINYIAVEKNFDVLVLAMEKVQAAGLTNVKFLAGDANIFAEFDTETRCDRIFINFCDPWKKSGQKKRRLTHERFLDIYKKLLNPGGEVHFKTDNMKLFEFSLNSFADYGLRMKNITLDLHNSGFEGNIMTEYETLFSEQGMPIYRCEVVF